MTQILKIAQKSIEFVIKRGCSNMCTHCYADAKPEIHYLNKNKKTSILWEDFENLYNGFKELNKRIGFKFLAKKDFVTLFHDGDASTIFLEDKNGKHHDYLDLAKKINEIADSPVLFDTSGWNIQDKKTQIKMEEIVKKAKDSKDYKFMEFIISINPFSPFYEKSLNYKYSGNEEKAKKFRDIYTDRMANVIYTMTPLFENNDVSFLKRAFDNKKNKMAGHQARDLKQLIKEIINKVKILYISDYNTEQKVVSSKEQIYKYIETIKDKMRNISTEIGITGRLLNTFKNELGKQANNSELKKKQLKKLSKRIKEKDVTSVVDINGEVYFTDFINTKKSDIQLNYIDKNIETPAIYPQ